MCAPPIQRGGFRLCPPSFPPSLFGVPMQSVMWCRPTPNRDPSHPHRPCNAQTVILSATKSPLSATQLRQIRVNVLSPHSPTSQSNSPNKDFLSPKYLSAAKRSVRQVHKIWLKWGFLSQIWFTRPQYFAQVLAAAKGNNIPIRRRQHDNIYCSVSNSSIHSDLPPI